ncbi:hypothetical protein J3L18_22140 [Mucilaginibacter gossypii]|uniref:hypothetical protein n=1 Tax=Mucilaginibacter gossypii TaxID=551996 RepID=UPI000DCF1622|nr:MULTISPECIES: hypothetical protein [Mucilaginibacter]QTE35829.1 hypothetical protein J3L18_22140 [Mucilaginibacter gossypii]RAV54634.1 hypothetical protein DIU36_19820 [Mucilaginibacter rubeus]
MKELDDINERMDGNDEIVDSLIKKIGELEKREVKTIDYTLHFEALQKIFEAFLLRYNKENAELKTAVSQLNISYPAEQIQNTLAEVKKILEVIGKSLPVKVKHEFDPKTKGWIIAGVILLIVTAICVGLCCHLWTENNRLQALDLKYRLVRQVDSVGTKWADSIYMSNPDKAAKIVIRMENEKVTKNKPSKMKISKRRKEPRKRLR